jgi:hypothetical protein
VIRPEGHEERRSDTTLTCTWALMSRVVWVWVSWSGILGTPARVAIRSIVCDGSPGV